MTYSELAAVVSFGLVALFAVLDGIWPHHGSYHLKTLFKL